MRRASQPADPAATRNLRGLRQCRLVAPFPLERKHRVRLCASPPAHAAHLLNEPPLQMARLSNLHHHKLPGPCAALPAGRTGMCSCGGGSPRHIGDGDSDDVVAIHTFPSQMLPVHCRSPTLAVEELSKTAVTALTFGAGLAGANGLAHVSASIGVGASEMLAKVSVVVVVVVVVVVSTAAVLGLVRTVQRGGSVPAKIDHGSEPEVGMNTHFLVQTLCQSKSFQIIIVQ